MWISEKVELLYQTLKFTPFLGLVDLLCILHFFVSWYRSAKKTGWKLDFWFSTLFLTCFLNTCLLYPFSASIYQAPMTIGLYEQIVPFVDRAFLISLLGYLCVWMGRYLFDLTGEHQFFLLFRPFFQLVENNIKSKKGVFALTSTALLLGLGLFSTQFTTGEFFNLRTYFLREDHLRPFFNLVLAFFPVTASFLVLRYLHFKDSISLRFFLLLVALSLFFGVRGIAVSSLFFLLTFRIYQREGRVSWLKLLPTCSFLFFVAVYLNLLRNGISDPVEALGIFFIELLYGNNFNDVRDFAWLLSFWDGEYFYGKSYFSGAISFIPRALSSLRQEWSFSVVTNEWIGFDTLEMPGLRPGTFGEFFFNFGALGVIFYGLLFGYVLRFADVKIKQAVSLEKDIIKGFSQTVLFSLLLQLNISAGLWGLYFFIFVNLLLCLFRRIQIMSGARQ